MTKDEQKMRSRIAGAIAGERFRRFLGPDWRTIAEEAAQSVMSELGLKQVEAKQVYPAHEEGDPRLASYVERSAVSMLTRFAIEETPLEVSRLSGRKDTYPGMSQITVRAWVITGNGVKP